MLLPKSGRTAVNGMSYHARSGQNANSAVVVTVDPSDFEGDSPLAGMEFQRKLEEAAWRAGDGKVPVQLFEDFCKDRKSAGAGKISPQIRGRYAWSQYTDGISEGDCCCSRRRHPRI